MPADDTYQYWNTEEDEEAELTGIPQQKLKKNRGYDEEVMQEIRPLVQVLQVEERSEQVRVKKLQADAIIPRRATVGAAGYDLYAAHDSKLEGKCITLIGTGVAIAIPPGQHGQIRSRSGLFKAAGLTAFPGIIDEDYRGEIKIMMVNNRLGTFEVYKGDRIAQMVIMRNETVEWKEVDDLGTTDRGEGGFRLTGANIIME
jgi:dUTP pyrophosphatase